MPPGPCREGGPGIRPLRVTPLVAGYAEIASERVYDVLQHGLDDLRRLRQVVAQFL